MAILVDTHVHLYSCYDIDQALYYAHRNLSWLKKNIEKGLFLTETQGNDFFNKLLEREDFDYKDECCIQHTKTGLYVYAGRQCVTSEKLEVLGLLMQAPCLNGASLEDTVQYVLKHKGIPVVPWSLGKWWGARGKVLKKCLISDRKFTLYLGDISMRSIECSSIFKSGYPVLAGSDPLPFKGEENQIGWLATKISSKSSSTADIRAALVNKANVKIIGWRNFVLNAALRRARLALK